MSSPHDVSPRPLGDIRVLDLTRVLAGPYCTMLLADLGAEVVKIERPHTGDDSRAFGPFLQTGESAYFASINRGKASITLDLKSETDRATFLQLVERADVVVENFRPGTMEAFQLGSARLRELNPRLVYASVTGFGRTGPDSRRPAYDVIVQALSGLMSITGHTAAEPARVGSSISDILAGVFSALAIVSALRERDATGKGRDVDISMLDCTVATLENALARFAVTKEVPGPIGTRHPSIAPFQAYKASDAPLVIAAGNDELWRRLCKVLAAPELVTDPLLSTNRERSQNVGYLEQQLNARLAQRTQQEWLALLSEAGVPSAPIRGMDGVLADPHLAAREMWHTVSGTHSDPLVTAGTPFFFDGVKPQLSPHWPRLGEDTERILATWLRDDGDGEDA